MLYSEYNIPKHYFVNFLTSVTDWWISKFSAVRQLWRMRRMDMIPFSITFLVCLRSSSFGILVGIGLHLLMLVSQFVHPVQKPKSAGGVNFHGALMYPAAEKLYAAICDAEAAPMISPKKYFSELFSNVRKNAFSAKRSVPRGGQ